MGREPIESRVEIRMNIEIERAQSVKKVDNTISLSKIEIRMR